MLVGAAFDDGTLRSAAEEAAQVVSDELSDTHATPAYRRSLIAELTKRVLKASWDRCEQ
jgi:CO/xanthine dehydrogenase FAD-binding subunit